MTTNNRGVGLVIGVIVIIVVVIGIAVIVISPPILGNGEQPRFDCEAADYIEYDVEPGAPSHISVELDRSTLENTTRLFLTDAEGRFADERFLSPPATTYDLEIETADLGMTLYLMNGSDIHQTCTLTEAQA